MYMNNMNDIRDVKDEGVAEESIDTSGMTAMLDKMISMMQDMKAKMIGGMSKPVADNLPNTLSKIMQGKKRM